MNITSMIIGKIFVFIYFFIYILSVNFKFLHAFRLTRSLNFSVVLLSKKCNCSTNYS